MTGPTDTDRPAWRDPAAPLGERVTDLLGRLTLAEKISLLHQHQPPIPRLGLGGFRTGVEALHGLAWLGPATVFPQAVGLASSWDPDLVARVGAAVADEVRGFHHKDPVKGGLNVWAPVVNPLRDPRWGRNEEGYSEDPWLTGIMATAYAQGLRGDHPRYLKTAPTLKHFLGYNNETNRDTSDSNLRPRVLHEYELPAFRPALVAGAAVAVMASYNLVNGRPAHLSPLINDALRRWSDEAVVVVSDAQAPSNLVDVQGYFPDHAHSHAAALHAGIDSFTDHDADSQVIIGRLTEAQQRGLIDEADVDQAVRRLLELRFRLGEFDPPEWNPYATITADVINCSAHQQLAREAARRSIVLLRNDGLLPMRPATVAVIGPLSDTLYGDWYSGTLPYAVTVRDGLTQRLGSDAVSWCEGVHRVSLRISDTGEYLTTGDGLHRTPVGPGPAGPAAHLDLLDWGGGQVALRTATTGQHLRIAGDGILLADSPGPHAWVVTETFRLVEREDKTAAVHHVASDRYLTIATDGTLRAEATDPEAGCGFRVELVADGAAQAAAIAADAEVAVVVLGNHPLVNGRETEDRTTLALPPQQEALLKAVRAANPRTVAVLTSSYPYAVEWADDHVSALLWSAHGGQEYGHALAEVLLGDADPAGRLTQTWYRGAADLPDLFDYDIIGTDATYLYFRGTPLYPFGHGRSYTTFRHEHLRLSATEVAPGQRVRVSVDVVNTGDRPGEEVIQLYTRQLRSRVKQPVRVLRGFARARLAPGQRTTVELELSTDDLAFWDVGTGRMAVEAAPHQVLIGASATDITQSATLTVHGERLAPRPPALPAVNYDDCSGVALTDAAPTTGDAVRAVEPLAWLEFRDVDLSGRPTQARLRASMPEPDPGALTLRRDDPLTGPVLATFQVTPTGHRHTFTDLTVALTAPADGVADLYLILHTAGTIVSDLRLESV